VALSGPLTATAFSTPSGFAKCHRSPVQASDSPRVEKQQIRPLSRIKVDHRELAISSPVRRKCRYTPSTSF
jgi:hypothetical protein